MQQLLRAVAGVGSVLNYFKGSDLSGICPSAALSRFDHSLQGFTVLRCAAAKLAGDACGQYVFHHSRVQGCQDPLSQLIKQPSHPKDLSLCVGGPGVVLRETVGGT